MKSIIFTLSLIFFTVYIYSQTIEKYIVTAEKLNMRKGAGTDHDVIKTLSKDDEVTLLEMTQPDWWKVDSQGDTGYVSSKKIIKDPFGDWQRINHNTGDTPECENIVPQYDSEIDNFLRIKVGKVNEESEETDVIVKLMKIGTYEDVCIRIVYIRGGESFEMKNIPEARYYVKIAYGRDCRKKIENNQCEVRFAKNAFYEKGEDILDFYKIKLPNEVVGSDVYERWDIPSFELSLNVISEEGVQPKLEEITEEEFNK